MKPMLQHAPDRFRGVLRWHWFSFGLSRRKLSLQRPELLHQVNEYGVFMVIMGCCISNYLDMVSFTTNHSHRVLAVVTQVVSHGVILTVCECIRYIAKWFLDTRPRICRWPAISRVPTAAQGWSEPLHRPGPRFDVPVSTRSISNHFACKVHHFAPHSHCILQMTDLTGLSFFFNQWSCLAGHKWVERQPFQFPVSIFGIEQIGQWYPMVPFDAPTCLSMLSRLLAPACQSTWVVTPRESILGRFGHVEILVVNANLVDAWFAWCLGFVHSCCRATGCSFFTSHQHGTMHKWTFAGYCA